jgi:hypothetical protein
MMNWRAFEGGGRGLTFSYYSGIRMEGLRKTTTFFDYKMKFNFGEYE